MHILDLSYEAGKLVLTGVPKGARYLIAKGHPPDGVVRSKCYAMGVSAGKWALYSWLSPGPFIVRVRRGDLIPLEILSHTDDLPSRYAILEDSP